MDDIVTGIHNRLKTARLGRELLHLAVADSTNDVARDAALGGRPEGFVVLADLQTAGRGRMGRTWCGSEGSLLMSLLLRPPFHPAKMFSLTMLSATATRAAVRAVSGLSCDLKWPNDLLLEGKKLGGILTEASLRGEQVDFAIVGIGVNVSLDVRLYPEISDTATSLRHALGHDVAREDLLCAMLEQIEARYELASRGDFEGIYQEWRAALCYLGRQVTVIDRGQTLEGLASDVDHEGILILRKEDGTTVRVVTGDLLLPAQPDSPYSILRNH